MVTAFGVPLEADEHVVFVHVPPPVGAGERLGLCFIGLLFLVIVVGLFLIIYAFTKQSDRAWFLTNKRAINVTAKNKVTQIRLDAIRSVVRDPALSQIKLGWGNNQINLPLTIPVNGTHMLTLLREPMTITLLPPIQAPP